MNYGEAFEYLRATEILKPIRSFKFQKELLEIKRFISNQKTAMDAAFEKPKEISQFEERRQQLFSKYAIGTITVKDAWGIDNQLFKFDQSKESQRSEEYQKLIKEFQKEIHAYDELELKHTEELKKEFMYVKPKLDISILSEEPIDGYQMSLIEILFDIELKEDEKKSSKKG